MKYLKKLKEAHFTKRIMSRFIAPAVLALLVATPSQATYIVNIEQFGNDVTATGSGSLPSIGSFMTVTNGETMLPGISTEDAVVIIGRPGPANYRLFFTGGVTSSFGFGDISTLADYGFGSIVGVTAWGSSLGLIVPENYVWGSELGLSLSTWFDTSLADMGLNVGTFSFVLGHYNTEVFRVNVIGPELDVANEIPAPSTFVLFAIGLLSIGFRLASKKNKRATSL